MKRIVLFVLTNLAVMLVLSVALSIIMPLLGIRPEQGGMAPLLVFAAVFGMGGAFISLAMSKWTAKRMIGAQVIEQPAQRDRNAGWWTRCAGRPNGPASACRRWPSTMRRTSTPSPPA